MTPSDELSGPARSLLLTLRARADESQRTDALLDDPRAVDWWQRVIRDDAQDAWYNPPFQLAAALRARILDEWTRTFIAQQSAACIVELGAGLSTRFDRVGQGAAHWLEVDLPDAIAYRRQFEQETAVHRFVAGSLLDGEWLDDLPDVAPESVLLLADGVLMFLPPDALHHLMQRLRHRLPGATIALDVVRPKTLAQLNAALGDQAPVAWSVAETELDDLGLAVDEIRYLLLEAPERWRTLGVPDDRRTAERSGYLVRARLLPSPG